MPFASASGGRAPAKPRDAVRVLLANEHEFMRSALRALLLHHGDLTVVGEWRGRGVLARAVGDRGADVVVMDHPVGTGRGTSDISAVAHAGTAVVVTSFERSRAFAQRLFDAGAIGYVLTDRADDELAMALRNAASGVRYLSPAVAGRPA
ncbi:MAG TPA: hypothetical protein VMA83_02180 [Solirubrobacteraceae bacterium]|nr:hypothetical protein [Solirubrobacteraceae bacterium]